MNRRKYGMQPEKITTRPYDVRYQRQQRLRQREINASRKPVAGQIIKEKEATP